MSCIPQDCHAGCHAEITRRKSAGRAEARAAGPARGFRPGDRLPADMAYTVAEVLPLVVAAALGGALVAVALFYLHRRFCSSGTGTGGRSSLVVSSPSHVEPLLVNGQVLASSTSTTTVDTALQATTVTPEYSNLISLALFLVSISTLLGGSVFILVKYFHEIWQSGFVAALLLGGIAFAVQAATVWFLKNVVVRRFYTTMQLSRENKESTPVLEWFKVWLPRYMKQRKLMFNNVAPLFRKKDGTTFFTMFQDTRNSDQFALSLWTMPGTHSFTYVSPKDGSRSRVVMHYYTKGEMKKTGWNNELVAQEYVDLYIFDPLHTRLPHFLEMLHIAQSTFGQKDEGALRFQRWNDWKEMWESRGADEPITANFRSLVFYEERLLRRVYEEVEAFLATPAEALLAAGLPLKLGFLLHGPPGTGKTHMVRHIAARYDLDIDIIDMNSGSMNNSNLMNSVNMASGILLLEDIDNVDAAIGVTQGLQGADARKVTLDGLLNALDGVQRGASKRIIIATTNYPEKLVPSLRRRGRLGVSFEVTYPSDKVMARLIRHNLPQCDADVAVAAVRAIEERVGIPTPTAALTDIFGKAGLRLRYPPRALLPMGAPPNGALHAAPATASASVAVGGDHGKHEAEVAVALRQVVEVLEEVASTNKKVFKSIHELLRFLGLDKCKTDGRVDAKGHTWLRIPSSTPGGEPPPQGEGARELKHKELSAALANLAKQAGGAAGAAEATESSEARKATSATVEAAEAAGGPPPAEVHFSEDGWKALNVAGLRFDHWVRASDGSCWRPDPEEGCKPHERPRLYGAAFEDEGCVDVKDCKRLDAHQLKDCIKISKIGHRMKLLEQFRFL